VRKYQFENTGGPDGHWAVFFDSSLSQYLDGEAHTFNIATNWGVTAVAVVSLRKQLFCTKEFLISETVKIMKYDNLQMTKEWFVRDKKVLWANIHEIQGLLNESSLIF